MQIKAKKNEYFLHVRKKYSNFAFGNTVVSEFMF